MPSPLLTRPSAIYAKIETTRGTAEALTGAEGSYAVFGANFTENTPYVKRPAQAGFGNLQGQPGAAMGTASFSVWAHGNGASGIPDYATTFLQACGYIDSTGTLTRTGDTSAQKSITLARYIGTGSSAIKQTLVGAVGTFKLVIRNGAPSQFDFTFTGKWATEATSSSLSPTLPTVLPPRGWQTFQVGSIDMLVPEATLDAGCKVKLLEGGNDTNTTGYTHGVITDFTPTLTCEPYQEALSVKDWRAAFAASTESALSIVLGTASNNVITIAASKAQLNNPPGTGDREGVATRSLNFDLNDANGFTIAYS